MFLLISFPKFLLIISARNFLLIPCAISSRTCCLLIHAGPTPVLLKPGCAGMTEPHMMVSMPGDGAQLCTYAPGVSSNEKSVFFDNLKSQLISMTNDIIDQVWSLSVECDNPWLLSAIGHCHLPPHW